jgi:hypothetical protein
VSLKLLSFRILHLSLGFLPKPAFYEVFRKGKPFNIVSSHKYVITMANITLSLPEELYQKLKDHPEIRWSEIARKAIQQYLDDLELLGKLTKKSNLTDDDVRELSDLIDAKVVKKLSKYQLE